MGESKCGRKKFREQFSSFSPAPPHRAGASPGYGNLREPGIRRLTRSKSRRATRLNETGAELSTVALATILPPAPESDLEGLACRGRRSQHGPFRSFNDLPGCFLQQGVEIEA